MLPYKIFNSNTLVVLELVIKNGPVRLPRLRSVCLPSLEVLHFLSIKFLDDTSIISLSLAVLCWWSWKYVIVHGKKN